MKVVAALFVQPAGVYASQPYIDAWPEERDARRYDGTLPVVAHPPCQRWSRMVNVNFKRYGGEHNRPGNDGGCFAGALAAVHRCGGVLEHPAKSLAWKVFGIAHPVKGRWVRSGVGWTCEVWQSAYGHRANKAMWLYYVGRVPPFELRWDRPVGTHQCAWKFGKDNPKKVLPRKERSATPVAFRDELLRLALHSTGRL